MRRFAIAAAVISCAVASFAQPVTVGKLYPHLDGVYGTTLPAPFSFVDIAHPAPNSGNLTEAVVYWTGTAPCSGAFTLTFLGQGFGQTIVAYQVKDRRGPFNATTGVNVVPLSPPVATHSGDVMAITVNKTAGCGNVWATRRTNESTLLVPDDLTTADALTFGSLITGANVNVFASGKSTTTVGYVPAAGAVAGAFGSFFRTSLQLTNQLPATVTGKIIFHRSGASGTSSDPSLAFTLGAGKSIAYTDVVTQMQLTGLGSLDIVTNDGLPLTAFARTFNDLGSGGTLGFAEEIVEPDLALQTGQIGTLNVPADPATFRTNLGFRTLDDGASVAISAFDANGSLVATTTKTFSANWFEQNAATAYLGIASLPSNGMITATIMNGEAIVYGTITDNRTNDSSLHYLRP